MNGGSPLRLLHVFVEPDVNSQLLIRLRAGQIKFRIRKITFHNFLASSYWHRIDIVDDFVIRDEKGQHVHKKWTEKNSKKAYTFNEAGIDQPGEVCWTSYRHQLEQFVNQIRGREGSGLWVDPEDSLAQAKAIDMAYEKFGLPSRKTSALRMPISS